MSKTQMRLTLRQIVWLLFISAISVLVAGAIAGVTMAAFELRSQITQVSDPEIDSAFVPATPLQMVANTFSMAAFGAFAGLVWGGPAFLTFGLPLHALLLRRGWTSVFAYSALGALVAAFVISLIMAGLNGPSMLVRPAEWDSLFMLAKWFALAGALCSGLFWLLRRPDRDARPPAALTSPSNAAT